MNRLITNILNHTDKQISILIIFLMTISLYLIGEASGFDSVFFFKQLFFIMLGLIVYYLVSIFNINMIYRYAFFIYLFSIALLILTLFLGHESHGSKRWIDLIYFKLQTSEIIKLTLPIVLVKVYDMNKKRSIHFNEIFALGLTIIPFLLIFVQPDLGTSLIILFTGFLIIFLNGLNYKKILFIVLSFLIISPYLWINVLKDYQKSRVLNLLDPFSNPLEGGYHSIQASIAIGSGGLFGRNSSSASQVDLSFLPETHTDFIFAVLSEHYGFIGNIIFFTVVILLISRAMHISLNLHSHVNRVLASTYVIIFTLCFFINVAMVSGLIPIVGVPLPIISYGGSALIVYLILFGFINSLNNNKTLIAD